MNTKDIKPPKELKGKSLAAWKRFALLLPTIEQSDIPALQMMAETWAEWQDACDHITLEGAVMRTKNGYMIANPYSKIRLNASASLKKLFTHFAMTPASRMKSGFVEDLPDLV